VIDVRFRPLDQWPGVRTPSYKRQDARFRSKYSQTLDLLEQELRHLKAKDIVIQAGFQLSEIRNDGWPRSNARRPADPGVIVSFICPTGALSFPCDRYRDWEDNLRAIALSLEALRAVDRYGVTQHAEQYKGWTQLPPAPGRVEKKMTAAEASSILSNESGMYVPELNIVPSVLDNALKAARRRCHPDAGGTHERFVLVEEAYRVLTGGAR